MLKARQKAIDELKKSELTRELAKALQSGDKKRIDKALKESKYTSKDHYETQRVEHAFLEK